MRVQQEQEFMERLRQEEELKAKQEEDERREEQERMQLLFRDSVVIGGDEVA